MKTILRIPIALLIGCTCHTVAIAEPCVASVDDIASLDLTALTRAECDEYWSGRLAKADVDASIVIERGIDDLTDEFKAKVLEGLQEADGALVKLGPGVVPPHNNPLGSSVRVIMTARSVPNSVAWAEMDSGRCFMVIDPSSWRGDYGRRTILISMAHELFHCVQEAVLPYEVLYAGTGTGESRLENLWWTEGSAEWFGILAQPDQERTGLAARFELSTDILALPHFQRSGIPLGAETTGESTWPFFAWYSEKYSAHAVIPFLESMPRRLHSPEDVARRLEHRPWGEFARQYSAFTIWMTGIGTIDPQVRFPQEVEEIAEGTHSIERRPAHMIRQRIRLDPGNWSLEPTVDRSKGHMFFSRVKGNGDPDGSWVEFDGRKEVHSVCGEPLDLMIAGFGSDPDGARFTYEVARIDDDCEVRCDSVPSERNKCVIGTWEDVNFDPGRAGAAHTRGIVEHRYPKPTYSFGADGRFSVNHPFYMHKKLDAPPGHDMFQITYYTLNATYGYWGTESGTLGTCEQQEVTRGTQVTGLDGQQGGMPLNWDRPIEPVRESQYFFRCNVEEETLELRNSITAPASIVLKKRPGTP